MTTTNCWINFRRSACRRLRSSARFETTQPRSISGTNCLRWCDYLVESGRALPPAGPLVLGVTRVVGRDPHSMKPAPSAQAAHLLHGVVRHFHCRQLPLQRHPVHRLPGGCPTSILQSPFRRILGRTRSIIATIFGIAASTQLVYIPRSTANKLAWLQRLNLKRIRRLRLGGTGWTATVEVASSSWPHWLQGLHTALNFRRIRHC